MNSTGNTIGRARMALVFGGDGNRRGVLTTVAVRARSRRKGSCVAFAGPAKFAESTRNHVTGVILPIVNRILEGLGIAPRSFEISVTNIGAAASHDLGMEVSGLSGDLPVILAMLSAALRMPVRDDFVATGHLASTNGDIVAVKGIAAKLQAAIADRSIGRFLYPDLNSDRSMDVLSPQEKDAAITAVMRACNAITAKPIRGIDELIAEAFTEEAVVLSSLATGFFHGTHEVQETGDPITRSIGFLGNGNDPRFWRLLQQDFSAGECERGTRLLESYATSFLRRNQYPPGFGGRLLRLLCMVPPVIRRLKLEYPLLDFDPCVELVRRAAPSDFTDVPVLFDAVRGKVPADDRSLAEPECSPPSAQTDCNLFDTVTTEIREQALTRRFDIPIDSARASFILASSTIGSHAEFLEIVESFFIHLQSHMDPSVTAASDLQQARDDALGLLERAFVKDGGKDGASVRARNGTDGGIRSVLDAMTETYKLEKRTTHVQAVLHRAIKGMDRDDRVRFARGALERMGPVLPTELRSEPPERFARQIDMIAQAYAKSIGPIERFLQSM